MTLSQPSLEHRSRSVTPSSVAPVPRYRNPIRVLMVHRNFRLFWLGQTGSVIGTWMESVARGWLALQLTNSAFMVGVVSAAGSLPVLLLTLYAGVVVDRHPKLRLVKLTQALLGVQAAILWWFDWSGHITVAWLALLSLVAGSISAFDIPARQALMIELVGREDVVDAIALNSSGFNVARVIGPALAAIVIDRLGLAWCFAINSVSFLLVLIGLSMIRLAPGAMRAAGAAAGQAGSSMAGLVEGLRFMVRTKPVALLMTLVAVYSIFGIPFLVMMPVFAQDVLHGGARTYGILLAAVGIGAVIGALSLAMVGHRARRGQWLAYASASFCVFLFLFSFTRTIWLSVPMLGLVGFAMIQNNALANGLLQTLSPDHLRGRVMAAYAFVFVGMGPIGSLLAGAVAEVAGTPVAVGGGAVVLFLFAGWVLWYRREVKSL
ncbi:MAG TPA: MFS transporter [Gemmatimonadaceae bacterium]|nr:MFS transporter [Gemmatimonadaceae bacterium]